MKTIVVDLYEESFGFDQVRPFFYPLIGSDELQIISLSPVAQDFQNELENDLYWGLKKTDSNQWQLVLLIDNKPAFQPRDSDKLKGFIREQLIDAIYYVLENIKQRFCGPLRQFVIYLDELERDSDFKPVDRKPAVLEQIETRGYVASDDFGRGYIFTESELSKLDKAWPSEIGSWLKNENTDAGIDQLNQTTKDEMKSAYKEVEQRLANLIEGKIKAIQNHAKKDNNYLMNPDAYEKLRDAFLNDLEYKLKEQVAYFVQTKKSIKTLFEEHLKRTFSLEAFWATYQFTWLRFPWPKFSNQDNFERYLLNLAYLIIFLKEQGEAVYINPISLSSSRLASRLTNFIWVKEIDIDYNVLAKVFQEYFQELKVNQDKISEELHQKMIDDVYLEEAGCDCDVANPTNMDKMEWPKKMFSYKEWRKWRETVGNQFDSLQREMNTAISDCKDQLFFRHTRDYSCQRATDVDLESKYRELENHCRDLRNEIKENNYSEIKHNFPESVQVIDNRLRDQFDCFPNWRQIVLVLLVTIIIFISPYLWTHLPVNDLLNFIDFRYLGFPLIVSFILFSMILLICGKRRSEIQKLYLNARDKVQNLTDNMFNIFKKNKDYLSKLCRYSQSAKNLKKIEYSLQKANRKRFYLEYHQTKLSKHMKFAHDYIQAIFDDSRSVSYPIDYFRPEELNRTYAPASFSHDSSKYIYANGQSGTSEHEFESNYLLGLKQITIIEYPAYS